MISQEGSLAWWCAYFLVNHGIRPEEFFAKPAPMQKFYIAAAAKTRDDDLGLFNYLKASFRRG